MKERSLLALHQVRDAEGPRAAANERVRLQLVVLTTAAKRLRTKSTRRTGSDAPAVSRGGVAHPSMGKHGTVVKRAPGQVWIRFDEA